MGKYDKFMIINVPTSQPYKIKIESGVIKKGLPNGFIMSRNNSTLKYGVVP